MYFSSYYTVTINCSRANLWHILSFFACIDLCLESWKTWMILSAKVQRITENLFLKYRISIILRWWQKYALFLQNQETSFKTISTLTCLKLFTKTSSITITYSIFLMGEKEYMDYSQKTIKLACKHTKCHLLWTIKNLQKDFKSLIKTRAPQLI